MDNMCRLGFLAAELLLNDFKTRGYKPSEVGVVLSNASASLDTDIKYYKTTNDIASPALFVYTLPNIVIGEICIRHHFKGENGFFITEKFDPEFTVQYVNSLFNNNVLEACVCGWIELFGDTFKTVLILVERVAGSEKINFNKENLNNIYQSDNG